MRRAPSEAAAGSRPPVTRGAVGRRALLLLGGALTLVACARVMSPPGWIPDRTPPQLLSTLPAQLAVVPNWKGPVVFRFDERMDERSVTDETAIVSPDTGFAKVRRHGKEIRVMPRGGWKPGRIYHVTLLPTIRDLFGNQRTEPAELVFSTGPAIPPTAIAGLVTDRLTGKPVAGALVRSIHARDSLAYTTVTDTAGFFALRNIPEGDYTILAFMDRNRDRKPQLQEPKGRADEMLLPHRDTVIIPDIALLAGDTTPARLLKAEYKDSLQIRLSLDDYLDPTQPLGNVTVQLWHLPDSVRVPVTGPFFPKEFEAMRARARAAADTTKRAAADSARRPAAPDTAKPLPTQELVIVPATPLAPRSRYRVTLTGITNISGLPGGGGSKTFDTPAPPKPPAADSTRAKGAEAAPKGAAGRPAAKDTTKVPAAAKDTTKAPAPPPRDTTVKAPAAAKDTTSKTPAAAPRDTLKAPAPKDTIHARARPPEDPREPGRPPPGFPGG